MKKFLSLVLMVLMVLSLAACENGEKPTEAAGSNKITVGLPSNIKVTDYDDNLFTQYLEDLTGLDIEFIFFPSSSDNAIRQIALMAAGDETFPEVLLGFNGMNANVRNEYGDAGYFKDLTELIKEYAPNYNAQMAKLSDAERLRINTRGVSESGGFYAMPLYFMPVVDDLQSMLFINRDWLNALGMEAPTNIEELYDVLVAFRDKDPNGNGVQDEIPMYANAEYLVDYIINAFVYYNHTYPFNVTDGKLWVSYTSDEFRQALIFANKLCAEGLLSSLSFTANSSAEIMSMNTPADGTAIVGITAGHPDLIFVRTSPLLAQYEALTYLDAATPQGGYNVIQPSTLYWSAMITADCKDDAKAMKFLDAFYLDDTVTCQRHGAKDVDWYYQEGVSLFGGKAYVNLKDSNVFFKGNHTWCKNVLGIASNENYLYCDNAINEVDKQENRLLGGACKVFENKKAPKEVCTDVIYTAEEYEKKTTYNAQVSSYVLEQRNYFILGQKDPSSDADWNEYLQGLERLELPDYLKLMQTVYDKQEK